MNDEGLTMKARPFNPTRTMKARPFGLNGRAFIVRRSDF
jgi:hypothetical protein